MERAVTRIDVALVDGGVWLDRIALWPVTGARLTTFISDHESIVPAGTTVTWTATATGTVQPLEFRFERRDDLGNWSIVQPYGMQATYTWTPSIADLGTNAVRVSVRNGGSTADFEDTATLLVSVVEGGEEGIFLRNPDIRLAWWKRWFHPRVPASLGIHYGSIATTSEGAAHRHSLYTPELQLLAEMEITASATPAIAYEYIWFGGQPLAQISSTGVIDWYFNDHLGTPILQMDAEAGVVWRVEYDPYGSVLSARTGGDKHQPLRFPGQENDGDSELPYNVFRHYRASWGRYTQADPLGQWDGPNLYAYVKGRPTTRTDRLGLATGFDPGIGSIGPTGEVLAHWFDRFRDDLEQRRRDGHRRFPREQNSAMRHCTISCESADVWGGPLTRMAGAANEVQGFVRWDILNIFSRLSGATPWAFQPEDLANNERGFRCLSFVRSGECRSCEECCAEQCCRVKTLNQ